MPVTSEPQKDETEHSIHHNKPQLPFRDELFNREQLVQYAVDLAKTQQKTGGTRTDFLLERLNENDKILHRFNNKTLEEGNPQYFTPATEWLIDNFYLVEEHIQLARRHFPKRYNKELPCLLKGAYEGCPAYTTLRWS